MGTTTSLPQYPELDPKNFPKEEGEKVQLKDGRWLGYKEYGIRNGEHVILLFPGLPGSRLFYPGDPEHCKSRILVLERPGFGLSSPLPNRNLLDWAEDVSQFLDLLQIKKFSIIGYSAGGPWALACLYKMPERIIGSAIISSLSPTEAPNSNQGMPIIFKFAYWCAAHWHWMLRIAIHDVASHYLKNPVKTGRDEWKNYAKCDLDYYCSHPEIEKLFLANALENYSRHAEDNELQEYVCFVSPWGFQLGDIKCKNITIYHGTADQGTTICMGRYIHQQIEGSRNVFVEGKGHLLFFEVWNEVIANLQECANERKEETTKQKKKKTKDRKSKKEEKSSLEPSKEEKQDK